MTEEMKMARQVQKNLRRIGVNSNIVVKDDMTVVHGRDGNGKPFAVRLHSCADADELGAFVDECDAIPIADERAQALCAACSGSRSPSR